MDGQLFTWQALSAMGGASLFTFLFVQYTKNIGILKKVPTDIYAVLVATTILILARLATGENPLDWSLYALSFANGFLVAAATGNMHDKSAKDTIRGNEA